MSLSADQEALVDVMRAVENRRSVARASNAGPSGVIDPWGRVVELFEDESGKKCFTPGWVICDVQLADGQTLYARCGDPVTPGAWMAAILALAWRRRREEASHSRPAHPSAARDPRFPGIPPPS